MTNAQAAFIALVMAMLVLYTCSARGELPPGAVQYLPLLKAEQQKYWPDMPAPHTLAGQVEQETCISLRHRKCWNPRAELKTSREYGFGFGQITRAYNPDGSIRFDTFSELAGLHPDLRKWRWEERYDPVMQLRALVLKDRRLFGRFPAATDADALAFMLAPYNGGTGGLIQDVKLCEASPGCDATRWFGHVEHHSRKSRKKWQGYGKSAFEINREYVANILGFRRDRYREAWQQ